MFYDSHELQYPTHLDLCSMVCAMSQTQAKGSLHPDSSHGIPWLHQKGIAPVTIGDNDRIVRHDEDCELVIHGWGNI